MKYIFIITEIFVMSHLVSQPVGALDGVVHVPPPVIGLHVAEGSVDPALGRHGVRSGGEELGDHGGLEALLDQPEGGAKTSTSGSDHNSVIGVVNHGVLTGDGVPGDLGLVLARDGEAEVLDLLGGGRGAASLLQEACESWHPCHADLKHSLV